MKPESYRIESTCAECQHVVEWRDWEMDPVYYCHIDKSKRPLCGSALRGERFASYGPIAEYQRQRAKWHEWANARKVDSCGTCDDWKAKEG